MVDRNQLINYINDLKMPVKRLRFVPVKCLEKAQMIYIMKSHQEFTAKAMADHLRIEELKVMLFCQANTITPKPSPRASKRKMKDAFHVTYIPTTYKLPCR